MGILNPQRYSNYERKLHKEVPTNYSNHDPSQVFQAKFIPGETNYQGKNNTKLFELSLGEPESTIKTIQSYLRILVLDQLS